MRVTTYKNKLKCGEFVKTYYDFMEEISSEDLYDRLVEFGMFSEKLPPVFSATSFLDYCKTKRTQAFSNLGYGYIVYENIRNVNVPRNIGIPTPMGHELLCKCLSDNWSEIKKHFKKCTEDQPRIISRIHIRKMAKKKALFEMNYKNWRIDGTPEPDIYIGKKYVVHADISKCYPSIYTHAIPWALAGKVEAKKNMHNNSIWYNQIDRAAQYSKNKETHGILIGPHTSNVLSEIILCVIDQTLSKKYRSYIRNIDDYICYTETKEEAERFLIDLNHELREFDLLMNHKKTEIKELPIGVVESWVHKIQNQITLFQKNKAYIDYKEVQAYIDCTVKLVNENSDNQSILLYAIKALKNYTLTNNAKEYLVKSVVSLALLYPYLVPILKEHLFDPFEVKKEEINVYANLIYTKYIEKNNYEACSFAVFYSIIADGRLESFDLDTILKSKDCILLLMAFLYCKKHKYRCGSEKLKRYAKKIVAANEMDQYWAFVYETLGHGSLTGDWAAMKKAKVSFLNKDFK